MERVRFNGRMGRSIKVNMRMTKSMGLVHLVGPTAGSMWGNGRRASSMVEGSIICLIRVKRWGSGLKERGLSGCRIISDLELSG